MGDPRKKMSDRVLSEVHKQFLCGQRRKDIGMLSWGEFTKMLRTLDLKVWVLCSDL